MPALLNPRHEKFARLYVDSLNASEAYRKVYKAHKSPQNGDASRLLANSSVKQRITELRAQKLWEMKMDREQLAGFYGACVSTPAGEITPSHPLCQAYEEGPKGRKVRMPDKVAAAQALARLAGWEAAQRVEVSVDNPLTQYLRELRSGIPTGHSHSEVIECKPLITNVGESND